jgi:soluble P-type ATPase
MIAIQRPGHEPLEIEFILLDFEGTLATDGRVHPKAKDKINLLSKRTKVYIFTTGEKERVSDVLRNVNAEVIYLKEGDVSQGKLNLLQHLGPHRGVAIGNGVNDLAMIEHSALGIVVMNREGTMAGVIGKADLVFMNILDALDFLLKPLRQTATLGK